MLSIIVAHQLSALVRMVGPLSSLSATSGKWLDTTIPLGDDNQPLKDVEPSKHTEPDHQSVSGSLVSHPGAVFTGIWRGGIPATGAVDATRPSLYLLIDGSEGFIRAEATGVMDGQLHIIGAGAKVWLNGEEQKLAEDPPVVGNTSRNWTEYAKGPEGEYPTWEDAVVLHKHIDAIQRSAKDGKRVTLTL